MMVKWIREKPKGWLGKFIINTTGAVISLIVTIVFFLTKLAQIWPVFIFLPIIIFVFHQIRNHYEAVGEQLRLNPNEPGAPIEGHVIVVPVAGVTQVVENSIKYAKSLQQPRLLLFMLLLIEMVKKRWKKNGKNGNRRLD